MRMSNGLSAFLKTKRAAAVRPASAPDIELDQRLQRLVLERLKRGGSVAMDRLARELALDEVAAARAVSQLRAIGAVEVAEDETGAQILRQR
jgi:predicted ArsR family transcriptional regulator